MPTFFEQFSGPEKIYALCVIAGGGLLIIRTFLAMLGGHADVDAPGEFDIDIDADADSSVHIFSLQGLSSFFVMFGLVALAISRSNSDLNKFVPFAGGSLAGTAMLLVMAQITLFIYRLQSSGNVNIGDAVGSEGTVYLNIPAEGTGQAEVSINNRLRMHDARSVGEETIATGERIRVIEVVGGTTLVVEKI